MLLPIRSKNPPESLPVATILLILVNVLVFALTSQDLQIKEQVLHEWGQRGGSFSLVHTLSSVFLHGDIFHLLGNMLFLFIFGCAVEGRLRTLKFLVVYAASGLGGDLLHFITVGQVHPELPSIGASGAIMGVLGAALYMFPHGQVTFFWWFWFRMSTFDWPMWGVALLYLGMDLFMGFMLGSADGVAHFAHVGGALGGFLAAAAFRPKRDSEYASEAKATLADTKDLSTLSRMQLAELQRSNPDDPVLVLNWAHKSLRDPAGINDHCRAEFLRLLPRMMEACPHQSVGYVLHALAATPGVVKASVAMNVATHLERSHDYNGAQRLYESVLRDPGANASDKEASLFRFCLICEKMGHFDRAANGYQQIVMMNELGPFGEQAKARLNGIRNAKAKAGAGSP